MLGFFDYTTILTYLSALSAITGIFVSLSGLGHPYLGCIFLMICGFCDAFDGKVARTKKNRTDAEKNYGIQIDSLSDLIAFGVLPACIGNAMLRLWPKAYGITVIPIRRTMDWFIILAIWVIFLLYVLAALIRLAYFNVMEEERQKTEGGARKIYEGLPVTSAALIFPSVILLHFILSMDITPLYFVAMFITGFLFLSKIQIPKAGTRGILIMIAIGVIELIIAFTIILSRGII